MLLGLVTREENLKSVELRIMSRKKFKTKLVITDPRFSTITEQIIAAPGHSSAQVGELEVFFSAEQFNVIQHTNGATYR